MFQHLSNHFSQGQSNNLNMGKTSRHGTVDTCSPLKANRFEAEIYFTFLLASVLGICSPVFCSMRGEQPLVFTCICCTHSSDNLLFSLRNRS